MAPTVVVKLVRGDDESLVADAVRKAVTEALDGADRSLAVEEVDLASDSDDQALRLAAALDAARTPPMFSERRVVVLRHAGGLSGKGALAPLLEYLAEPSETTTLVVAWERDPRPGAKLAVLSKALSEAIEDAGGSIVDVSVGNRAKERAAWLEEELRTAEVRVEPAGVDLLLEHLGEDVARARGVVAALRGAYGPGVRLSRDEVQPYLGATGGTAPWDLTDAIDRGDVKRALEVLDRMVSAGGRHPLQIMAVLHNHVARMLRLDGSGVRSEREAADLLGVKGSTYPVKKAMSQLERVGGRRVAEMVELLAQADLDLRGASAWPDQLVVEVLVGRLAVRSKRR